MRPGLTKKLYTQSLVEEAGTPGQDFNQSVHGPGVALPPGFTEESFAEYVESINGMFAEYLKRVIA